MNCQKSRSKRNAIILIVLILYTIAIVFGTAAYINRKTQGKYISMEAYLAAEDEVSLLNDKVENLEKTIEEMESQHKIRIATYDMEIDHIMEEFRKYKEGETNVSDPVKYEGLPHSLDPKLYRIIVTDSSEKESPTSKLTVTEMNNVVNTICEERADANNENPSDNPFYNSGDAFFDMECETGINALYVMAIFTVESGFGQSMCRQNNAGGITNSDGGYKSFKTIDDCILYTGQLLSRYRDNHDLETINEIASRYCPNDPEWPNDVNEFIELYSSYV